MGVIGYFERKEKLGVLGVNLIFVVKNIVKILVETGGDNDFFFR